MSQLSHWKTTVEKARCRIQDYIRKTQLEESLILEDLAEGAKVYLKLGVTFEGCWMMV